MEGAWPADVVALERFDAALGPALAVGAVVWRYRGELRLTIVGKATFDLVHDGPMAWRAPDELVRRDSHLDNNPLRSVRDANDLAPYRPRADVTFVGHAYAPRGGAVAATVVRLAVYRDTKIIDRSLHVYGDRDPAGSVRPFERIALWPERALATLDNPIGARSPNVVDARDATRAGSFAPISRLWPPRARLLRGAAHPMAETLHELPDDFDWDYFQAAPAEQQVAYLRGDEWVVLDGVHPTLPRLKTQLPTLRSRALVHAGSPSPRVLDLVCDSLAIDGDRMTCAVGFRGSIPVGNELGLAAVRALVGLEVGGEPIDWSRGPTARSQPVAPPRTAQREKLGDTKTLTTHQPLVRAPAVPFVPADHPSAPGLEARVSWVSTPLEDDDSAGTTNVYAPHDRPSDRENAALPFVAAAEEPTLGDLPGAPRMSEIEELEGTFALSAEESRALAIGPSKAGVPKPPDSQSLPWPVVEDAGTVDLSEADMRAFASRSAAPFVSAPSHGLPPKPVRSEPRSAPAERAASEPSTSILSPEQASAMLQGRAPAIPFPSRAAQPVEPAPSIEPTESEPRRRAKAKLASGASFDDDDFSGADLSALDFDGRSLLRCKLVGTNLRNARFVGAKLAAARLTQADLEGAIFEGADLDRADLTEALVMGARFDGARMSDTVLAGASGAGASFRRATGQRASFAQSELGGACFDDASFGSADFSGASFARASFVRAALSEARMDEAKAMGAIFDSARLSYASIKRARLVDSSFENADANHAAFTGAILSGARFTSTNLLGAALGHADCGAAIFSDANLTDATLDRANLENAAFTGARLERAKLEGARANGANFVSANLRGVDLCNAHCTGAVFSNASLVGSRGESGDFTRASFVDADLTDGSFRSATFAGALLTRAKLASTDFRNANLDGANVHGAAPATAKLAGASTTNWVETPPSDSELGGSDRGGTVTAPKS